MALNLQFSPQFIESLESILQYYDERNGSDRYSRKLLRQIFRGLNLLTGMPDIGCQTDHPGIRILFIEDFGIDYEKIDNDILVIDIYSCLTNPALRKYRKK
jgi:toxin YoeB